MLIIPDCLTCTLFPFLPSLPVSPERKFLSPILLLQTSGSELSPLLPAYLHVLCASHSFSYCHVPTELLDTQAVLGLRACWFISYHLSWRNLLLLLFSCSVISNSFATLRTVAHQDPLSMGFPGQEYWSGLSFPPPEHLPDPGITHLLHWQVNSLPLSHPGNPSWINTCSNRAHGQFESRKSFYPYVRT